MKTYGKDMRSVRPGDRVVHAALRRFYEQHGRPASLPDLWPLVVGVEGIASKSRLTSILYGLVVMRLAASAGMSPDNAGRLYVPGEVTYPFRSEAGVVLAPGVPPLSGAALRAYHARLSALVEGRS